jgi:hypothetical protein
LQGAFIAELIAGILYLALAVPLILRGRRTQSIPERFLGLFCLILGVSYVLYEIPPAMDVGPLAEPLTFAGRVLFDAAVILVAVFNRRVFQVIGGTALVWATVLLVLSGLALSALHGDWGGYAPLRNAGFWLEWSGQLVPFAWLGVEAGVQWARERRRTRLGLTDLMGVHRLLLWSLFALLQLCANFALVFMYVEFEVVARFSVAMDLLVGALEFASIIALVLAFFPPAPYCQWLARSARQATQAGSV